jgi:hypothetical protein
LARQQIASLFARLHQDSNTIQQLLVFTTLINKKSIDPIGGQIQSPLR